MKLPSAEWLRSLFLYDEDSGALFWKPRKCANWNSRFGLKRAGSLYRGYRRVCITVDGKAYSFWAHRLVWAMHYGEWPVRALDHINHQRDDNRIQNLREVTAEENNKNRPRSSKNKSGYTGVIWNKRQRKWNSFVRVNNTQRHLGSFDCKKEAALARSLANKEYGFHKNHGAAE